MLDFVYRDITADTSVQCNMGMRLIILSYDVAVIQWIMSCHKNRMTSRVITLARVRNVIDNVCVNNAFPH